VQPDTPRGSEVNVDAPTVPVFDNPALNARTETPEEGRHQIGADEREEDPRNAAVGGPADDEVSLLRASTI
jgi:hypothetical protein